MVFAYRGAGALDYCPVRYGNSRLLFRGPARPLDPPYCAVVGGTETYGKFVADPYPALVERQTGLTVVNLGCLNAGPDVFLNDPGVLELMAGAAVSVVQVIGAHNLTNRFYAVHPRRNDRFLRAEPELQALFPDVDFTEFHFTRHMLRTLRAAGGGRFAQVSAELRRVWVERMTRLVGAAGGKVVLLWLADHAPENRPRQLRDPYLVEPGMLAALRPAVTTYVEVVFSSSALTQGLAGMSFSPLEQLAATQVPGPAAHAEAAAALAPVIAALR
jgi:hypothetical protein